MKRTYKKTLALTLVLILLIQLCPIPIARAASTDYWNINDIPYANKFVELYEIGGYIALDDKGDLWQWTNGLPQKISINAKFKQLSADKENGSYWVALDTNGNVWGCGTQTRGQLGTGLDLRTVETINDYVVSTPVQITSGTKFTKVVATHSNVLALDDKGNIWGWGQNNSGTLISEGKGDYLFNDEYYISLPKQLTSNRKYKDIDSNGNTAGAIDENNNLYMWGSNQKCQLAASSDTYKYVIEETIWQVKGSYNPVQVKSGRKFSKVSIGSWGVAALDTDGLYWRWGLVTEIGMSQSSASNLEGYDSSAEALYEPYNDGTTKYVDVYSADSHVIYLKIADNQGAASNKIFVIGNNKDYYGNTEDEYGNKFGGLIEQLNGFTIIGPGLALDKNGYMWRWGFEYINSEGERVKAEEPIQITGEKYTVTFKDGNTVLKTETVLAGGTAEAPANPTKTGYTFKGWDKAFTNVTSDLTVNATWEANVYNVTLETNGGAIASGSELTSYTYGIGATLPTNVTKTGYTFGGWYANEDLSGNQVTQISTTTTGDKTYYAKWTANANTAYKVEYYYQQDDGLYSQTATTSTNKIGTTASTIQASQNDKTPTSVEGKTYVFDSTNLNNVLTATIAEDGTTVLKIYFKQQYTVTYKPGTKGAFTEQIKTGNDYNSDTPAFEGAPIGEAGYTFAGWSPKVANKVTKNSEYTALWTANANIAYKVEHYKQNIETNTYDKIENDTENLTGRTGDTVNAIAKIYEGYTENKTHENRIARGKITGDGKLVLRLYYDVNKYTVKFKNGETVLKTEEVKHGGTATAPENPTKTGHTFKGWDKTFNNITSDLEVNATWDVNVYNIELETNGGKIASGAELTSYTYGIGATLPTDVTKIGYVFDGWYNNSDLTGEKIANIGTQATGDRTYYAKWIAATNTSYTVEHYKQNLETNTYDKVESDTENLTGTTGATVNATAKTYEGYTQNLTHGDRIVTGEIKADGSLVLKLYYDVNEYTVTFISDGETINTQKVKHGGTAQAPSISKQGYTLSWDKEFSNITSDLTVNAKWTAATNTVYKVEHYKENLETNTYDKVESDTENLTGTTGATVNATAKTYEGYTENLDHDDTIATGEIKADGSLVLKLYYDVNEYTVIFKDGDTILKTEKVKHGGTATQPILTKEGYTLSWSQSFTNVKSDLTITAIWTAGTGTAYTVEHYKQNAKLNGYELVTEDVKHLTGTTGATATVIGKTYEGFTENLTHPNRIASGEIKPDGSLVLRLYYDRNSYKVNLDTNGGSIKPEEEIKDYTYGIEEKLPIPEKEGYIFDGWYDNSKFAGEKVETITNVTGDKEYYAKWKISEYTVIFVNDGKTVKTETVTYGGKATAPVLTRTGYILSWNKDFSNVKSDLTVTAIWTEDKDEDTTIGGKLPQTGETYIIAGTISILISIAAFLYLKYRKVDSM